MVWILISSMTFQNDIEKWAVHWKLQYWYLKPYLSKLKVICMITQSIKIVKLFKESCPVRLCMCSSAEFALPFLQHVSTGPDLRAAMAQQLATVESGIWDALWSQLAAIAAGIVGYQGSSDKLVLLKISVSVGYLKSQFEILVRKKEKLAQLVMLERMQTEEKRSSCTEGWVSTCIGDGHQDSIRENLLEWKAI